MAIDFDLPDGATPLDKEQLEGLKLAHIVTRGDLDAAEQANIIAAQDWARRARTMSFHDY